MISKRWLQPATGIAAAAALFVLSACLSAALSIPSPAWIVAESAAPTSLPTPTADQGQAAAPQDELATDRIPARDRFSLAARFKGITNASTPAPPAMLPQVGDVAAFWVDNTQTDEVSHIHARLVYSGEHIAMWIEDGLDFDAGAVTRSAQRFDQQTYPTDRAYFGSEPLPGIDGDPRVNVLNNHEMGGQVAGYFNSPSEYPASIVPNSNEKEIIYLSWDSIRPGSARYDSVLAHEFQHMIHWNVDRNEDTWVNEGMSEVAAYLNGFGTSAFVPSFMSAPDTQLNAWEDGGSNAAHYGAAFLFNTYFLDRVGQDALRALVRNPDNGLQSFDTTLAALNSRLNADGLFKDWLIANLVNDPGIGEGQYAYRDLRNLPPPVLRQIVKQYPASFGDEAHQYGAHYIQLPGPGRLNLHFEGALQVAILPTQIGTTGGGAQGTIWWSNRADDSDMTLTRQLDLSGANSATLDFDLWYSLEEGWDYGYVEVSPDGGLTWTILQTGASTVSDPHGNAYGPGYSGQSARQPDAGPGGWLHQTASLDGFAGQKIMLRFEVITDDAVNLPGMAVDNICIHAINWCDDVESETPGWEAEGFARIDNAIAQKYGVQVIVPTDQGPDAVLPLPLDETNTGDLTITVGARPATLVISGMTRYTTEPAPYHVTISPVSP
jgi:immune inhibitor A